jgi:UDP-2,4-diacetamido-2,4,6-trideoxy-beta-L-altropyranose hydrolase
MRIVFRVDASIEIGTGHVMRCLTLANKLKQSGCDIQFICRDFPGNLCWLIEEHGFVVHRLPFSNKSFPPGEGRLYEEWLGEYWAVDAFQTEQVINDADHQVNLLIVDHYAIDRRWEQQLRRHVHTIMVIDDLANRQHDCDLLLDQNLYESMHLRYQTLTPQNCVHVVGPKYALLRDEFVEMKTRAKVRRGDIKRIFLFFGGSDPTNETTKALEALQSFQRERLRIDVVVGNSNPYKQQIAKICSQMQDTHFHCQINYMAELMVLADLAVAAGGSNTWERCAMYLPTMAITTAENQIEVTKAVANAGALHYLGDHSTVTTKSIVDALHQFEHQPNLVHDMSSKCMDVMGTQNQSGTDHIAQIIGRMALSHN